VVQVSAKDYEYVGGFDGGGGGGTHSRGLWLSAHVAAGSALRALLAHFSAQPEQLLQDVLVDTDKNSSG